MNELDNLNNWLETEIKPALNKLKNESQELNIYINNINKTIEHNITEMNTVKDKMNKIFYGALFLGATNLVLILMFLLKK